MCFKQLAESVQYIYYVQVPYQVYESYEVEVEYEYHILNTTLVNNGIQAAVNASGLDDEQLERYGVILALENQWTPLNQSRILLEVMEYFHSPFLGLCYDSGHGNLTEKGGKSPEKSCVPPVWNDFGIPIVWEENLIEKFVPWMVNCHLHDNDGSTDSHSLPGEGNVDWHKVIPMLKRAPRLAVVQSEVCLMPRYSVKQLCAAFEKLGGIE